MDSFTNKTIDIKTGDLLLFSGIKHYSVNLQIALCSKYNHIGIALWIRTNEKYSMLDYENGQINLNEFIDNDSPSDLFVFESSEGSSYDLLTQKNKFGCRLVRLKDIIKYYDEISVRHINIERGPIFYERLNKLLEDYKNVDYDTSPFNLVLAPLGISVQENNKETFCSELVATYLYRIGLLPIIQEAKYPARYFLPKDFSEKSEKIPNNTFIGELETFYLYKYDFLTRYGIYIIMFLLLIFLIFIRLSMH